MSREVQVRIFESVGVKFPHATPLMFRLFPKEAAAVVSQNVIPHRRYFGGHFPRAFTEHGVAMLFSVLNSHRAAQVNIQIMRTFTRLRRIPAGRSGLAKRLNELEHQFQGHEVHIRSIFAAIRELVHMPEKPKSRIGFQPP